MSFEHKNNICDMVFSIDSDYIVSITKRNINLWSTESGKLLSQETLDEDFQGDHTMLRRSSNEDVFCLTIDEWDQLNFQFWEIQNGEIKSIGDFRTELESSDSAFQVTENEFYISNSEVLIVYNRQNSEEIRRITSALDPEFQDGFNNVAIANSATKIAFLNSEKGHMIIQDTLTGDILQTMRSDDDKYFCESDGTAILFNAIESRIISYFKAGEEVIGYESWSVHSGEPIHETILDHAISYHTKIMRISDCGSYLWMIPPSNKGTNIHCWDLTENCIFFSIQNMPKRTKVDISPLLQKIAFGIDKKIELEDIGSIEDESLEVGNKKYY